ncbi:efflux RND transporter periplasmic adaptor subunit [Paracoccus marcusii]|uniref:Efflux RND transporter periplasmic adaptor subunit n=1 Tax=Paracoccus marcusii TaxID=59779 RepID=A0ABY7UTE5_9RHOB|nr:efflux RND transporter periplasmic adaptor subunit [Paracoccus marcusii]WDA12114.1 efflux RND transporter periplasmic adaptor subunit [Paracoccus marcusii]
MTRYLSSSTLAFLAILGFLAFWIGGGMLNREPPAEAAPVEVAVPHVAASMSVAEEIVPRTVLFGNVVPDQTSILRARTAGIVEEVVRQGHVAERGEQLALLSADDREAGVARADAAVGSAERDYDAARQLRERGVTSEAELQSRFAQLESARAELRAAQLELQNTRLTAPISGTVSNVMAELGSFVDAGGEVLEIVRNDPLIAQIEVRQSEITSVALGQSAQVVFQGGREAEGRVRFIAPVATAETRTFRVEVEVPNPDNAVPAGLSAQISLAMDAVRAHRLSPALIRLDDAGRIGVFVVAEDGQTLRFAPVQIVQARAEAIWVTGLEDRARVVTISQGALSDGQQARVSDTPEPYRDVVGDGATDAAALLGTAQASDAVAGP